MSKHKNERGMAFFEIVERELQEDKALTQGAPPTA